MVQALYPVLGQYGNHAVLLPESVQVAAVEGAHQRGAGPLWARPVFCLSVEALAYLTMSNLWMPEDTHWPFTSARTL